MGIIKTFFSNTRKPHGLLGKLMVVAMNHGHGALADWGIEHLPPRDFSHIAEIGCGGGKNALKLLNRYPQSVLNALDYSRVAVDKTARLNRAFINEGRCRVTQGDVAHLPYEDDSFDLVTAFETVYFWPGPLESFREVARVLQPGGLFLIVNESDGMKAQDQRWSTLIEGLTIYSKEELVSLLLAADFSDVVVNHDEKRHWLCILAIR